MRIGEQIKNYRKIVGLTQEQVANYLGVSTPAVNKWEKGNTYPDISLLPALARLLKIDMNELFSFREELTLSDLNDEERMEYNTAIIEWLERTADSQDERVRNSSVFILATKYVQMEKYEEANVLLKKFLIL